uniref:Elongation factor 1-gamma n=1 Tax=Eimeria stiedai TaxID=471275 RepID=A0A977JPM5_9EIME|nr:elongation factor 1-gamma [Eimeria stiedai]
MHVFVFSRTAQLPPFSFLLLWLQKLLCPKDDLHGQKVLATAAFADIKLETPSFVLGKDDKKECFKRKSPLCRVPVLETETGPCLAGSSSICRYLARMRVDKHLYGESLQESGEVDMWMDFCSNEIEVPLLAGVSQPSVASKAKADVTNALKALNEHLKYNTYLVGKRITVADICLCVVLKFAAKNLGCDVFKPFAEVNRWKETICNQKSFKKVCSDSCSKSAGNASASPTKAAAAAPKKGEEDDDAPPPPKPKCDLDLLPPSPLDLNEWKRVYSNTKNLKAEAMPWLWKNFDDKGYCFYYMKYEKLEGECTVAFLTSNQLGGFLQRIDNNFRKYSFGVIDVVGKGNTFDIQGVWMFRGLDIPQMMKEHPSYEYNVWKRLDHNNEEDRKLIEDYFCNDDEVEGTSIADSKVWK